jgi:hypothetical protein
VRGEPLRLPACAPCVPFLFARVRNSAPGAGCSFEPVQPREVSRLGGTREICGPAPGQPCGNRERNAGEPPLAGEYRLTARPGQAANSYPDNSP